jgi:type IV secretory pathway TrbF-like protein
MQGEKTMKSKKAVMITVLGLILSLAAMPAASQEKPSDNMPIVVEKIRADKKLLVAENLQLTDAEAKSFWPVYRQYQDELFLLRTRTVKLIKDYSDAYETMTDNTAKKLLDEYMTIEALGPKLRKAYLPKFRKALPEAKVARYYQIENKIQAALFYELAANIPLVKMNK